MRQRKSARSAMEREAARDRVEMRDWVEATVDAAERSGDSRKDVLADRHGVGERVCAAERDGAAEGDCAGYKGATRKYDHVGTRSSGEIQASWTCMYE